MVIFVRLDSDCGQLAKNKDGSNKVDGNEAENEKWIGFKEARHKGLLSLKE